MIRIRPLSLCLALALIPLAGTSFAATATNTDSHPQTDFRHLAFLLQCADKRGAGMSAVAG